MLLYIVREYKLSTVIKSENKHDASYTVSDEMASLAGLHEEERGQTIADSKTYDETNRCVIAAVIVVTKKSSRQANSCVQFGIFPGM